MKPLKELTDTDFKDIPEVRYIERLFDHVNDRVYSSDTKAYSVEDAIEKIKDLCRTNDLCKRQDVIVCRIAYHDLSEMHMTDNCISIEYIEVKEDVTIYCERIRDRIKNFIPIEVDDSDIIHKVLELGKGTLESSIYLLAVNGKIYADEQLYYNHKRLMEESSYNITGIKTYSYISILKLNNKLDSEKIRSLDIKLFYPCKISDCRIKNLSVTQIREISLRDIQGLISHCKINELKLICNDNYYISGISLNCCEIETLIIDLTNVKNRNTRANFSGLFYDGDNNNIKETKVIINREIYKEVYGNRTIIDNNKELNKIVILPQNLKVSEIIIGD